MPQLKLFAAGPFIVAIALSVTLLTGQPKGAVVRGPVPPEVAAQSTEVPEWLKTAIQEQQGQNSRQNDNGVLLTLLMIGNLLMTGIGFMTVVFKGGKYVEKVDRNELDIERLRDEVFTLQKEIHSAED